METKYENLMLGKQLCFPLYAAAREIVKKYNPYLHELDLTYTQYIAMMVMWEEGEISAKAMGEKLFLDSGTLTPVLKALEKKGFVIRARSKADERVLLVSVTQAGMDLRDRAKDIPEEIGGCIPLDQQEMQTLYQLLYKILGRE